jgi:hypothetical protein
MPSRSSSGHKLGQIIGDWYEQYFALPLLESVSSELSLYLDHRFKKRNCRGDKVIWEDSEGNAVDYDFVIELGGTNNRIGLPVAFFETFWRRGARHSKDKARDDSGKLVPMRHTYPTARILGVIAAGDFSEPAQNLLHSRNIRLFYVSKTNIINAWNDCDIVIDYDDKLSEIGKGKITEDCIRKLEHDPKIYEKAAERLNRILGRSTLNSYRDRIKGILSSGPQDFKLLFYKSSDPYVFYNYDEVESFLKSNEIRNLKWSNDISIEYSITFDNGDVFERSALNAKEVMDLHAGIKTLIQHMEKFHKKGQ